MTAQLGGCCRFRKPVSREYKHRPAAFARSLDDLGGYDALPGASGTGNYRPPTVGQIVERRLRLSAQQLASADVKGPQPSYEGLSARCDTLHDRSVAGEITGSDAVGSKMSPDVGSRQLRMYRVIGKLRQDCGNRLWCSSGRLCAEAVVDPVGEVVLSNEPHLDAAQPVMASCVPSKLWPRCSQTIKVLANSLGAEEVPFELIPDSAQRERSMISRRSAAPVLDTKTQTSPRARFACQGWSTCSAMRALTVHGPPERCRFT